MNDYGNDKKSAIKAKHDAQKIAFGPIMFQAAKGLRDFGILKLLLENKNGKPIEEIAKEVKISIYGVKVMLEAGLSMEMVYLESNIYKLTKTGFFIESDKLTKVNMNFTHDVNYLGFFDFNESIKTGKPSGLKALGEWDTVYEGLAELPKHIQKSWFEFDHFYSDTAFPEIMEIVFTKGGRKVLDVGGNTGKFSIKCAIYNTDNQMTILDLPGQVAMAKKNIEESGFSNRIKTHAINLLDSSKPFPKGYNTIWMSQFLDCFSQEEILTLLQRSYDALDENGSLFILETYWDRQKYEASTYSLHATSLYFTCIANGNSQMYHSRDMEILIDKANMKIVNDYDNIGVSHTLFEIKKK